MEPGRDKEQPLTTRLLFPLFVLICGLGATGLATYLVQDNLKVRDHQRLMESIYQIEQAIDSRMEAYVSLLRGGAGIFASKEQVTQTEFRRFYERLEIPKRYPGLQGYGYSVRIPAGKLASVEQTIRREGMTNFAVRPSDPRPEYHAIIYLEPHDERNLRALGFDMFSEPVRRKAMITARDTGNAAFSRKVKLVQELDESNPQPGFLIYLPIYFGGDIPPTVEERRARLQGFIYSPFRAGDLFKAMLPPHLVPGVAFAIWDETNALPENLLYQSDRTFNVAEADEMRPIDISGGKWMVAFWDRRAIGTSPGGSMLWIVPIFGVIASVLLSALAQREAAARRRSERAVNELFEQREWLDVTLASIVDAVITTDTFGRVQSMNSAAEEITGETIANARGKPIAEFFSITDESSRRPLGNPAERVLSSGEVVRFKRPVVLRTRGSAEKSIDPSAAPIRDRNQELVGAVLVFREITERRKYERRSTAQHVVTAILSESKSLREAAPRLLEAICGQLDFEIGIWWHFDEASGLARAEELWRRPDRRLDALAAESLALAIRRDEGLPGRVWAEGRTVIIADITSARNLPRLSSAAKGGLNGALAIPVLTERHRYGALEFFTRGKTIIDPELEDVFYGLGRQIGQFLERKSSEEALAESEELYRAVSETAADGVIVIDEESRILTLNSAAERIFGYSRTDLYGESLTRLMPSRMHEAHFAAVRRFVASGNNKVSWSGVTLPGLHRDGHEVPLEISFGAAKRGGKYIFTGLVRDITERKRAEEAIRELNQELETRVERRTAALLESKEQMEAFTYTVAHDLRAPLRAMQGFAHALLDDYQNTLSAEANDYLQRIMSASERMDILIQDLLAYSQLSRSDLQVRSVNLREVLDAALLQHQHEIRAKGARVELSISEVDVEAHALTLEHALSNLISNALKFTRSGETPRITIRTQPNDSLVRLCVQDNGIGIAPEYHERIFRVFERLHGQEAYPGTGIGLAIVKKGIERMGGRVGLNSAPGEGTEFWIDLRPAKRS